MIGRIPSYFFRRWWPIVCYHVQYYQVFSLRSAATYLPFEDPHLFSHFLLVAPTHDHSRTFNFDNKDHGVAPIKPLLWCTASWCSNQHRFLVIASLNKNLKSICKLQSSIFSNDSFSLTTILGWTDRGFFNRWRCTSHLRHQQISQGKSFHRRVSSNSTKMAGQSQATCACGFYSWVPFFWTKAVLLWPCWSSFSFSCHSLLSLKQCDY